MYDPIFLYSSSSPQGLSGWYSLHSRRYFWSICRIGVDLLTPKKLYALCSSFDFSWLVRRFRDKLFPAEAIFPPMNPPNRALPNAPPIAWPTAVNTKSAAQSSRFLPHSLHVNSPLHHPRKLVKTVGRDESADETKLPLGVYGTTALDSLLCDPPYKKL